MDRVGTQQSLAIKRSKASIGSEMQHNICLKEIVGLLSVLKKMRGFLDVSHAKV